jgi:1,4-alpha-glucan branching enzyme
MKTRENHTMTMTVPAAIRKVTRPVARNGEPRTRRGLIEVNLTCAAPHAQKVFVAGDFNGWCADDLALRQDKTGSWSIRLRLTPGRHEYRFIVDGEWQDDPHAAIHVPNEFGSSNCVLDLLYLELNP